jgi:DNA end-binding protein Ku
MAPPRKRSSGNGSDAPNVRPFWSGTLTFGLVSIPVALYSAVRSRRPGLRMLDEKGQPLERRYFDRESGKTLPREDIVRGFEMAEGEFVVVQEEELDRLAPEKSRDIDLRRFVPVEQLDPLYWWHREGRAVVGSLGCDRTYPSDAQRR